MPKLHELLAVEANLKGQADKTRHDLMSTFEKKRHLFTEKIVTYQPLAEGVPASREEELALQTTVGQELGWVSPILAKAMDTAFAIAVANTQAKADVMVEGRVMLEGVPATALLELEKRVTEVKNLVEAIPTLDPAKGFEADDARGTGIYRARDEFRPRTKKDSRPLVLYEATKEHPAQVQLVTYDVLIGKVQTQEWSGLITPAEKAAMIARVETLHRAIKQARARANEQPIEKVPTIGSALLSFVFGR